jgi:hypothetical protein
MREKRRFRWPAHPSWRLAVVGAALAALCAFGIGALTATGAGSGQRAGRDHARSERFRDCMTSHGVKPPRERGARPSRQQLDRALSACRRYLPKRAQRDLQRMQRFRSCMSQRGVQPPRLGGSRPDRQTLRRALRACREYAPRHAGCGPGHAGFRMRFQVGPPPPPGEGMRMGPPPPAG